MATKAQRVRERLRLAEQAASQGNLAAARNYAQAAANIQGSGQAKVQSVANQYAAAAANAGQGEGRAPQPVGPPGPGVPGGGTPDTEQPKTVVNTAPDPDAEKKKQLGNTLRAYFKSIGLGALSDWAVGKAADGFTQEYIELEMRNQPAYKQRFPAMQSFMDNSIPFTEAEYMEYEQAAQSLDQRYGLPGNMIYNAVTDLLTNRVDAEELSDRAAMAGAAAMQAPEDFKTTMRDYYGIDEGGLAGYFLDPDNVVDSLKKQSAASLSGTIAGRQGIANLPKDLAEDLYDRGVREESQMVEGFSQANQLRGLSSGKTNTASQEQLIRGSFGDSAAQEAVAKVQRIRRASNRGGGGYVGGESGASGLGSASY